MKNVLHLRALLFVLVPLTSMIWSSEVVSFTRHGGKETSARPPQQPPSVPTKQAASSSLDDLKVCVVKITASRSDGTQRVGTGFMVGRYAEYITTAAHVVEGATDIKVEFYSRRNQLLRARVVGMQGGDRRGLAALQVEGTLPPRRSLRLDVSSAVGGESVATIGFPRVSGVLWAVITGSVVGRVGATINFSGAVDEGNSGGPLIRDGQAIGVVVEAAQPYAYAVPSQIAQYVLEGWGVVF